MKGFSIPLAHSPQVPLCPFHWDHLGDSDTDLTFQDLSLPPGDMDLD